MFSALFSRRKKNARPIHRLQWGWLLVVAGVHAMGLYALSGLDRFDAYRGSLGIDTITVSLLPAQPAPAATTPDDPEQQAPPADAPAPEAPSERMTTPQPEPQPKPLSHPTPKSTSKPTVPPVTKPTTDETPNTLATPAATPPGLPRALDVAPDTAGASSVGSNEAAVSKATERLQETPASSIVPARFDPAYLRNPAPAYPSVSRRRGEEGDVLLRVRVSSDGRADEIEIMRSSGHPRLDQAANAAVRRWRFEPAREGDLAIESWVRVPIKFRIQD